MSLEQHPEGVSITGAGTRPEDSIVKSHLLLMPAAHAQVPDDAHEPNVRRWMALASVVGVFGLLIWKVAQPNPG